MSDIEYNKLHSGKGVTLSGEIKREDACYIKRDIVVGGTVAFFEGQQVVIEDVSPNPQRPEYKYVVLSIKLGRRFQLDESVLERSQPDTPSDIYQDSLADGLQAQVQAQVHAPLDAPGDVYLNPPDISTDAPAGYGAAAPAGRVAELGSRLLLASSLAGAFGFVVLISTFMPWISIMGFSANGWSAMTQTGANFLFVTGEGTLYFTGFWSLLVGAAAMVGAILLFQRKLISVKIIQIAGLVGGVAALFSIISTYTKPGLSAAYGIWVFILFSVLVVAAGHLGAQLTR